MTTVVTKHGAMLVYSTPNSPFVKTKMESVKYGLSHTPKKTTTTMHNHTLKISQTGTPTKPIFGFARAPSVLSPPH
jgi:hypothetical protein